MSEDQPSYGSIEISPAAVATIASQAVNQSYGVVGMAAKNFVNGIAQTLSRDSNRGIDVRLTSETLEIDVYVVVEYGMRIRIVAESIQNTVKFHVEKALGREVTAVNVFVQGLRHSDE